MRGQQTAATAQCKDQHRGQIHMFLVHKWVDGQFEGAGGVKTDEKPEETSVEMQDVACV